MDLEQRLSTHADPKPEAPHDVHKTYFLSDEAINMLKKTDFLDKIIFDNKYEDHKEFVKAVSHLCYKNIDMTRKISKKLLKCISYSNND
jgi:hypothetical protein